METKMPSLPKKSQITITQLAAETGEDELTLKIAFKLQPSKTAFSKVKAGLTFDSHPVNSVLIRIPQGPLATDELEYGWVLDMAGIAAGRYAVEVEMYEVWGSGERLGCASGELLVDYGPQTRQSRLVRVPSVKSVAGADLAVASGEEQGIFADFEESRRKENISQRDEW
jgi:hypothetical protein